MILKTREAAMKFITTLAGGGAAAAFAFSIATPAFADSVIEVVPTAWRLQDYLDGSVWTYFTGSPCSQGHLTLPASTPADSKNRYWSMIMSAKFSGKIVGVYYVNNNGSCIIQNFYLREQ